MGTKTVFLYPGQGSQEVGMGFDLFQSYPRAKALFDRADHLLGFSLSSLCFEGPAEELNSDLNAQMAVYTVSCVVNDLLKSHNALPDMVSGYSSGFYAAAYAAGCFDFEQGLRLVQRAGEMLLSEGKKIDGIMAVVFGLSAGDITDICGQVGGVEVAILNSARQAIISGIKPCVKAALELCLKKGALDAYSLPVGNAYHSSFMKRSSVLFLKEMERHHFTNPRIPLVSYLSLNPISDGQDLIRTMATQLSGPVRWVDLIRTLCHEDTELFLEVGPGAIISRTVRWIERSAEIKNTTSKPELLRAIERCREVSTKRKQHRQNLGTGAYEYRKRSSI